jgi:hypothetical protein
VQKYPAPFTGNLSNTTVYSTSGNFSGNCTYTLRVNGVNSTITINVTNAASNFSDNTHTVAVTRGDLLSVQESAVITNSAIWFNMRYT